MQDYIGKQIDRYRITNRLGKGGMAVVYKAYDTRLEREVALKLIRTEAIPQEQHERLMKRFEREAKAQARFAHPNIVSVHDYGEFHGAPYLVMEYLPGGTLKSFMTGPINFRTAIEWLIPIMDAVQYAHERNVIHRDIKPSNILFDERDQPILTDFGIAKVLELDEVTLTGTGLGVGTPEYMAPEQWCGQASPATDQYALGVVLYELLTGVKPYQADTPAAVAIMQATEPLRSPRALAPEIPDGVEKLLYEALEREPQDRYEDMNALRMKLKNQLVKNPVDAARKEKDLLPGPLSVAEELGSPPKSEVDTLDELAPSPIESRKLQQKPYSKQKSTEPPRKVGKEKARLPGWSLWVGVALLVVVLLAGGMAFLSRGSRGWVPLTADEPTEVAIMQLETPHITPTEVTLLPKVSETPLSLPTASEEVILTSTPTREPKLVVGETMTNPADGAQLVSIPASEFIMGSEDSDAWEDEMPQRKVYVDDFWIYKYPVTNRQFSIFVEESGHQTTAENNVNYAHVGGESVELRSAYWSEPDGPGSSLEGIEEHPVVFVSWFDALAYCEWMGGRLPTEAEWEKAARGTDGRRYPWGNQSPTCSLANYRGCVGTNSPVGSNTSGASPFGVLDMAGNVWEWVADWYDEEYYSYASFENPPGPDSGDFRVARGGSWSYLGRYLRVSTRRKINPNDWYFSTGFRCVIDVEL